ncbi:hypothetical protein [Streptomyces rhizosphaericola]|uniref:hypothetical protein n=1 Tax=Streptomyces rhizosphaericola TaxID=2564098 RepID=UPI003BF580A2
MTQTETPPGVNKVGTGLWWGMAEVRRAGVTREGNACFWLTGESGGIKIDAWYYGARPEMAMVGEMAIAYGKKVEVGLDNHEANSQVFNILLAK